MPRSQRWNCLTLGAKPNLRGAFLKCLNGREWSSLTGHLWWWGQGWGEAVLFLEVCLLKTDHSGILQHGSFQGQETATPLSAHSAECISSTRRFHPDFSYSSSEIVLHLHVYIVHFRFLFMESELLGFFRWFQGLKLKYLSTPPQSVYYFDKAIRTKWISIAVMALRNLQREGVSFRNRNTEPFSSM